MKRILCLILATICVLSCFIGSVAVVSAAEQPLKLTFNQSQGGIKIYTNGVTNSSRWYRFYVKTSKNGSWQRFTEVRANNTFYSTNTGGKTYYFTARPVDNNGKFLADYRTYSCYYCNTPGSLKAEQTNRGIKITWDKCYGVTKYRVYWKTSDGGWARQGDTYDNYFVDTRPKNDWTNVYTVRGLDSDGDWCTGFKTNGCSCYQGGPQTTLRFIQALGKEVSADNPDFRRPEKYWTYSGLPKGSEWCTGFANYCIGKCCGSWRFAGEYGYYDSPSSWHPYTSYWAQWANEDGIFRQPDEYTPESGDIVFFTTEGDADTWANVCHVGIVYLAGDQFVHTLEGNTGNMNPSNSRVNSYAYLKMNDGYYHGNAIANRYISGFISMRDIYNRAAYR